MGIPLDKKIPPCDGKRLECQAHLPGVDRLAACRFGAKGLTGAVGVDHRLSIGHFVIIDDQPKALPASQQTAIPAVMAVNQVDGLRTGKAHAEG